MSTSTSRPLAVSPKLRAPFVGAPRHRLFVIFDNLEEQRRAVVSLRLDGYRDEDDVWVFYGEDGLQKLDLRASSHGMHARVVRLLQRMMSNDFAYLEGLDQALRQGRIVLAIHVRDVADAAHVSRRLRSHGGRAFAYCEHWDFDPVAS